MAEGEVMNIASLIAALRKYPADEEVEVIVASPVGRIIIVDVSTQAGAMIKSLKLFASSLQEHHT